MKRDWGNELAMQTDYKLHLKRTAKVAKGISNLLESRGEGFRPVFVTLSEEYFTAIKISEDLTGRVRERLKFSGMDNFLHFVFFEFRGPIDYQRFGGIRKTLGYLMGNKEILGLVPLTELPEDRFQFWEIRPKGLLKISSSLEVPYYK
ncbi:hypothetical protein HN832_04765 [archaeon]|jgi:hypothetical protein|nr:hypothetical protein [archaeon]MBT4374000.1 hypothetical protein [archaeon]MBT4532096.1 hypothetical protein [archaeon]MBT7001986.1 hypothetical protein [archaeon]MBT7282697.1 hypothetical protein [archaeon]